MSRFDEWVQAWGVIGQCIEQCGGTVCGPIIGSPASEPEILAVEKQLGTALPESFRKILAQHAGHASFSWYFPDEINLPDSFMEIASGEIFWDIAQLESLDNLAEDAEDDSLRGAVQFMSAGNGDILAFGLSDHEERPVVYWSHEGEGTFLLGKTFEEYIHNLTALYCVGSEFWQYEMFLGDEGIDPDCEAAAEWKAFMATFENAAKGNWETHCAVLEYAEIRGVVTEEALSALRKFSKEAVIAAVEERLSREDSETEILYQVLWETVPQMAASHVRNLWNRADCDEPELRSRLTALCLPVEEGLPLVFEYAAYVYSGKSYIMDRHLVHFADSRVIDLIRGCVVDSATKDDWYDLFARSNPRWRQITEWLDMGGKHRMVVIYALNFMIHYGAPETEGGPYLYRITEAPSMDEMRDRLMVERDRELLKTKKTIFERAAEVIEKRVV